MADAATVSVLLRADDQLSGALRGAQDKIRDFGRSAGEAGRGLLALSAPLVAIGGLSLKAFTDFESSFAGVRKTVNATEEQFQELATGFRRMAKEIPVSVNELNRIGEAAGQLGIKTKNILLFSRTMADLGVTTNLSSDQAATALARLANITGLPQTQVDRLGAAIVALGNNLATTEAEIMDFGLRIAGAGTIAGLTEAQILAIGGAMSSVGVQAEAGGTAVQKVLLAMTEQVATSGELLRTFAATAGMTAKEFSKAFKEDAAGAFMAFVEGLGAAGTDAFAILEKLGLEDQRLIRSFLSLAGAGDLLRTSIDLGTKAFAENTALTEEARKRYETAASQFAILKNNLQDVAITIGEILIPPLLNLVKAMHPIVKGIGDWIKANPELTRNILIGAAAVAGLGAALMALGLMLPGISAVLGTFSLAVGLTSMVIGGLVAVIGFLLSWVGLIAAAIALLAVAWVKDWGEIREKTRVIVGVIIDIFVGLKDAVLAIFQIIITAATVALDFLIDRLNNWISVYNKLPSALRPWKIDPLEHIEFNLREFVGRVTGTVWEKLKAGAETTFEAAGDTVSRFVEKAKEVLGNLPDVAIKGVDWIIKKFGELTGVTLPSLTDMIAAVKKAWGELFASVAQEGAEAEPPFIGVLNDTAKAAKSATVEIDKMMAAIDQAVRAQMRTPAERLEAQIADVEKAFAATTDFWRRNELEVMLRNMRNQLAQAKVAQATATGLFIMGQVGAGTGPQAEAARKLIESLIPPGAGPPALPGLPVPMLQYGGLITRPTLAFLGERGPEAVVPLGRGAGGATLTINTTINGPVFGEQDMEDKIAQIWRDVARAGGFRGLI